MPRPRPIDDTVGATAEAQWDRLLALLNPAALVVEEVTLGDYEAYRALHEAQLRRGLAATDDPKRPGIEVNLNTGPKAGVDRGPAPSPPPPACPPARSRRRR
jgi:hypothetical protein